MAGWPAGSPTVHRLVFSSEHTLVAMNMLYFRNQKRVIRSASFGFGKQTPEPGRGGRRLHLTPSCEEPNTEAGFSLSASRVHARARGARGGVGSGQQEP